MCTQSKFFATACKPGFQASQRYQGCRLPTDGLRIQEGDTGVIELKEDDELHVEAMIEYLYTFNYDEAEPASDEDCVNDENHAHSFDDPRCALRIFALQIAMYVLGDKYDVNSLMLYACSRLRTHLHSELDMTYEIIMMVMDHAYHHSRLGDELRKVVIEYIVEYINRERSDGGGGISTAENFYSVINGMPDVSEALIRGSMARSTESAFRKKKVSKLI